MTDIFVVMRQCRIPEEVLDLSMIIYRTTFIIAHRIQSVVLAAKEAKTIDPTDAA
jgi:ABC-type multidrug transport system fused ATPase/permease subunit